MGEVQTGELAQLAVGARVPLPKPRREGAMSVEASIQQRRSRRSFASDPLEVATLSQLLWSAQGVTSQDRRRAAPSAGACYPLELYLACAEGLFHYLVEEHALEKTVGEDVRAALVREGRAQGFLAEAPAVLLFAAVYARTTDRYGERGLRYVHIDVGHAAENVHLQAEALGLASVAMGAFSDAGIARAAQLPADQAPVYMIPVGRPAGAR